VKTIGRVTELSEGLTIRYGPAVITAQVTSLSRTWHGAIPDIMSAPVAAVSDDALLTAV
jgi:hypothetical protein